VYDPAEDSWTAIASMMVPRCEFGLCAVDGRLYAFGGWVGEDIGKCFCSCLRNSVFNFSFNFENYLVLFFLIYRYVEE
jgi:hypothetical protein